MTGKEFARHVKVLQSDMPVILCTGFSDQIDNDEAIVMGINAFILKPIVRS